jgi:SAM-dependent methyltransferase
MLFVELALIRWMGSNIIYLSYFSNFILLGSFLGIGLGFLRGTRGASLFRFAPVALAVLVSFVLLFPVQINRSNNDLIFFGNVPEGPPIWVMLPAIFLAVALVMMCIGAGVARTFEKFEPLEAYRLDVLGSIAGILSFTLLSFLGAPPVAWGAVAAVLFLVTMDARDRTFTMVAVAGLVVMLGIESTKPGVTWSPYYKITTFTDAEDPGTVNINVNGIPHQSAEDRVKRDTQFPLYAAAYTDGNAQPSNVLIIGAGSGNDVAEALAHGVKHIDAVEIDPKIYRIGVEQNPNRPYDDPRVDVHLDDGRAYVERSHEKYDLIILALPDSLTLVAGQSSLRLESYLFTKEAMTSYRDHLAPGGVFSMYNFYRETWLRDRYAGTLNEVFGQPPCLATSDLAGTIAALTASSDPAAVHCAKTWAPSGVTPVPAADDHPFPYLLEPTIPAFYLLVMGLILVASLALVSLLSDGGMKPMLGYTDLFAMGAAFLLLETKSVVQFALLFGTTWFVNALVFTGVLLSVYLAVELSIRVRALPRVEVLYAGLLVSIAAAWLVPLTSLLALGFFPRFLAAVALTFAPIFFANLIFAQRFRDVGSSTAAFGANLLGAMVGGLLEYVALITGYRSLLLLVAVLYGVAFVIGRVTWMKRGPERAGVGADRLGDDDGGPAERVAVDAI